MQTKGVYAYRDSAGLRFFCVWFSSCWQRVVKSICFLLNSYYKTTSTLKGDGSFWNIRAISAKNTVPLGSEINTVAVVFLLSTRLYMPNNEQKLSTNILNRVSLLQLLDYIEIAEYKPDDKVSKLFGKCIYCIFPYYLVLVFPCLVSECSLWRLLYSSYSGKRNFCQN